MLQAIALSENAVAVLRFEIKGYRSRGPERRLAAYRELAAAGIMELVPGSGTEYRLIEDGLKRREEILEAAEAHLRGLATRLPPRIDLSDAARELVLRLVLTEDRIKVTPDNLEAHRELVQAGIMFPVSGFDRGPESNFRFTDQGWDRRHEWIVPSDESS